MRYRTIGGSRRVSVISLGAMLFGSVTDEETSYAILDRYVEAGGTFIDTANNYAFWVNGTQGGESEELLGRWRRSRGIGGEVLIATKLGGRPLAPARQRTKDIEGLTAKMIREQSESSRERLGVDRLDLLYAHVEDPRTPLAESVAAFGELIAEGSVELLGASNHWAWRVERARSLAAAEGVPGFQVLQYHHSYLRPRTDLPTLRSPDGHLGVAAGDLLSYVRENPELALVAYSPLLGGAYTRADKPLGPDFDHPGNPARMAVLREVAAETGATANQVVLSWLIGGDIPVIPLVGASSVAQLDESLAAADLELTADQRERLDRAGGGDFEG
ncbi:MAG: aldo/keto reductase [Nonomuraea sp.]|nr:aldo/keto reductase [Nonomuraea sp.]